MTREQKMIRLDRLNGPGRDDEDILYHYLDSAGEAILKKRYPSKDISNMEVPREYENKQINIAMYLLGKRGAEGQVQHIENGIHRNWGASDIPDEMLADIIPYCKIV